MPDPDPERAFESPQSGHSNQPKRPLCRVRPDTRFAAGEGRSGLTARPSHFSAASLTYVATASLPMVESSVFRIDGERLLCGTLSAECDRPVLGRSATPTAADRPTLLHFGLLRHL